jgi:hypothetical protein
MCYKTDSSHRLSNSSLRPNICAAAGFPVFSSILALARLLSTCVNPMNATIPYTRLAIPAHDLLELYLHAIPPTNQQAAAAYHAPVIQYMMQENAPVIVKCPTTFITNSNVSRRCGSGSDTWVWSETLGCCCVGRGGLWSGVVIARKWEWGS